MNSGITGDLATAEQDPSGHSLSFFNSIVGTAPGSVRTVDEDATLILRCQAGDLNSFAQLVSRHEQRVRGIVSRILTASSDTVTGHLQGADIDDLSQEVFLQAWRALPKFRGDARFSTWLYRIAVNRALKEYNHRRRGNGRIQGVPVSDDLLRHLASIHPDPAHPPVDPEGLLQQRARDSALREAVEILPEKQRLVVLLHYFEDCSCEEIAEIAGCSVGTVWSRLHYACRRLQERLIWMDPRNGP